MSSIEHLKFAAMRAAERPAFMAWVFARHREMTGATDADIQTALKCTEDEYIRLSLCGIPRSTEEAREMAEKMAVNPDAAQEILEAVKRSQGDMDGYRYSWYRDGDWMVTLWLGAPNHLASSPRGGVEHDIEYGWAVCTDAMKWHGRGLGWTKEEAVAHLVDLERAACGTDPVRLRALDKLATPE